MNFPEGAEPIYPADWTFRIVLEESRRERTRDLCAVLVRFGMPGELKEGRLSTSGRYRTWHARARLASRSMMEELEQAFASVEGVKFVL